MLSLWALGTTLMNVEQVLQEQTCIVQISSTHQGRQKKGSENSSLHYGKKIDLLKKLMGLDNIGICGPTEMGRLP
jgi:hypothetical protein